MKFRYISGFHPNEIKKEVYDVVVLGSGVAGLFTALNIDKKYKVALLSKEKLEENNSNLAQGGIAACVDPNDDFKSHYDDTLRAGAYYNREETTKILIEEAPPTIKKLLDYGTQLDKDENGLLKVTREGGHQRRRIVHAKDATGREVIRSLGERIKKVDHVVVYEYVFAIDILTEENGIWGLLAINNQGEKIVYKTKAIVLATGGIGQIYKNTTNSKIATGDGIAMAYRAGAIISDMEFVQLHPTAMYTEGPGKKFLISEAVRGEGAILRNIKGETFMEKYHKMGDLAPRDIVARSIFMEMMKNNSSYVYLDITHKSSGFIKSTFPTIYSTCLEKGIDMTKDWIPVAPAEHYLMGGIVTDRNGKTNINGLYACGECACTGVHGANRLASNSLLEGMVFGNRIAQSINKDINNKEEKNSTNPWVLQTCKEDIDFNSLKEKLQNIMDQDVSIIRSEEGLKRALKEVRKIKNMLCWKDLNSIQGYEMMNMCMVALLIIKEALARNESLGAHYRVENMEDEQCIINF